MARHETRCWCGEWHRIAPRVKSDQKKHTSMRSARRQNRKDRL